MVLLCSNESMVFSQSAVSQAQASLGKLGIEQLSRRPDGSLRGNLAFRQGTRWARVQEGGHPWIGFHAALCAA